MKRNLFRIVGEHLEILLLLFLITLNIFDLFEALSPTFDYLDKIAGIIVIAYLIYLSSPSKIILGQKHRGIDGTLIVSYVLLMFNKVLTFSAVGFELLHHKITEIITFSKTAAQAPADITLEVADIASITSADITQAVYTQIAEKLTFFHNVVYVSVTDGTSSELLAASTAPFSFGNVINYLDGSFFFLAKFIVHNQYLLERITFYLGGIMLILLSIYAAYKTKIRPNSFLHVMHGDAKLFSAKPLKAFVIFLTFSFFFLFIFSLMIEWLGIVADAPIVFLGVLFYILAMIQRKYSTMDMITKVGETGEAFYERFIELFHTPHGVALGFCGILLLHTLSDFGMFVLPYTVYQHEMIYFDQGALFFAEHHTPLFSIMDLFLEHKTSLFFQDIALTQGMLEMLTVGGIYFFNVAALVFLFLAPAYIWWVLFKGKKAHEKRWVLVLSYIALVTFIAFPLLSIGVIEIPGLVGADMQTHSITEGGLLAPGIAMLVALGIGALVWLVSWNRTVKREEVYLSFAAAMVFFGIYLSYYFIASMHYYFEAIMMQLQVFDLFVLFYLVVFGLLTVVFYPLSYILFIYEIVKYYRLAKNE